MCKIEVRARMAAKPGAETPTMIGAPLARLIIRTATSMASDASSYVTGQTLHVNGGMSMI